MDIHSKTKDELIAELKELQKENRELKLSCSKNIALNPSLSNNDKREQIDFKETKEHFELIFNTSPDASLITRLKDGLVVEVNDGFTKLTGFTREETLGTSSDEIKLWKNSEDRHLLVDELLKNGFCENLEGTFMRKNGSSLTGLISARTFILHDELHIFSIVRDITERKKAEEELLKSNAYLENLINYANAPIIVWDPQFRITRFNHAFENLTGYKEEEVLGKSIELLFPPALADMSMNLIRKTQTGERFESVEIEILHCDKTIRIVLWNSATLFSSDGITPISTIAQGQEITKRRKAEETLRQSEEKFRTLYANMIDGSALHTLVYNDQGVPEDYRIIEVNPAFEAQLGISREAVINKTSKVAYGVDDPPYFETYIRVALTGRPEVFETYFAPLEKHFSISVYCPYKGSFATIFENITERKKAEQDLKIILAKYQILFDIFPIGITISDASGKIIESNQIAETLLGISREEQEKRKIDGQEWQIIRTDGTTMPASEFASVKALEQGRQISNVEMGIVKGDNQIVWLNVSATPVPIEGYGVAIVYVDISESKKAEEILRESEAQLKELNATKDKFFSIIAHDLKGPFNGILGFSEKLKDNARYLDIDSILAYIDIINSSAKQTYKLLENLLEWARMQRGGISFEPKAILISGCVNNEIEGLKYDADQKNITLVNGINKEIIITADEKMLCSIIRNLISNAIKFTPKGGKVNIEAILKPDNIEISVSDTGIGIEKSTIEKLFKIETSFSTRGTENENGTGLGLLLCQEFVEMHGGTIRVESEKGKGSRFTFSIHT